MTDATGKGHRRKVLPPFAQPDPGRRVASDVVASEMVEPPELPSIDQFVDDLPMIDEFLAEPAAPVEPQKVSPQGGGLATDDEGWAVTDWQSYDWSGIASLGAPAPEEVEAHAAWSSTNWDSATGRRSSGMPPHEVAAALDEIARRIRSGELSLAQFQGTPPEAAIATVFAALLRAKG
jgi:hypothetical protein